MKMETTILASRYPERVGHTIVIEWDELDDQFTPWTFDWMREEARKVNELITKEWNKQ